MACICSIYGISRCTKCYFGLAAASSFILTVRGVHWARVQSLRSSIVEADTVKPPVLQCAVFIVDTYPDRPDGLRLAQVAAHSQVGHIDVNLQWDSLQRSETWHVRFTCTPAWRTLVMI